MDPLLHESASPPQQSTNSRKMGLDDAFLELGWGLDAW
jgi:hypothetical protein